nr:unnamed protein product [Callosobruchus analis]
MDLPPVTMTSKDTKSPSQSCSNESWGMTIKGRTKPPEVLPTQISIKESNTTSQNKNATIHESEQSPKNRSSDDTLGPWETQRRRGFKQRKRNAAQENITQHEGKTNLKDGAHRVNNFRSRPAPIKGANNGTTLKTVPKMAFLFLSGFAPDVNNDEILNFLCDNDLGRNCVCEKMKTRKDKHSASSYGSL